MTGKVEDYWATEEYDESRLFFYLCRGRDS